MAKPGFETEISNIMREPFGQKRQLSTGLYFKVLLTNDVQKTHGRRPEPGLSTSHLPSDPIALSAVWLMSSRVKCGGGTAGRYTAQSSAERLDKS